MCLTWQHNGQEHALDLESLSLLEEHVEKMGRRGLRVLAVATARSTAGARLLDVDDIPTLDVAGLRRAGRPRPSDRSSRG